MGAFISDDDRRSGHLYGCRTTQTSSMNASESPPLTVPESEI
jgi:hypothetical protein